MTIKYRNTSRRKTPWDDKQELSPIEIFIRSKYLDNYEYKHPKLKDTEEATFLNAYILESCKYCESDNIQKRGKTSNGIQRYLCLECHKSFNILTNTIFDNHKIPITEWIEFCLDIFNYGSISLTSKVNKNSYTTSRYWLQKLFLIVENIQDNVVLHGKIEIDETYYPVIESDKVLKDGKQLRGLSINQYCIGIGYDKTNVYAYFEGVAKPSQKRTKKAFIDHIAPNSHLIHDKEKSHKILVKELNLTEDVYDANEIKKLPDKKNPLYLINRQCYFLKLFLNAHSGFDRDNLQDYINLFCFMQNPPYEKLDKVKILLNYALCNTKSLKYREFYFTN